MSDSRSFPLGGPAITSTRHSSTAAGGGRPTSVSIPRGMSSKVQRYSPHELKLIGGNDSVDAEFVPTVFLCQGPQQEERIKWRSLLRKKVIGCWLAAREREIGHPATGYVAERNEWVVILELPDEKNVTIELRQADDAGNTITICRPGLPLRIVDAPTGLHLIEGYACSFVSGVTIPLKLRDWIDRLEKSGITRYRLRSNRGRRYWIDAALRQFGSFIDGRIPDLDGETEMLHVWASGCELDTSEKSSDSKDGILPGDFLPTKWPRSSHLFQSRNLAGERKDKETQTPFKWIAEMAEMAMLDPCEDDGRGQSQHKPQSEARDAGHSGANPQNTHLSSSRPVDTRNRFGKFATWNRFGPGNYEQH